MDASAAGRLLIVVGLLLAGLGAFLVLGGRLPLGRLPGDIAVAGGNGSFLFPVVTCLVISVVLTVIINIVIR